MGYVIECQDGPGQHWYILGSSRTETDADRYADRYRKMLWKNGCNIRVRPSGE